MDLKTELLERFHVPEEHIDHHASDLHVVWSQQVENFLRNEWTGAKPIIYKSNVIGQPWFGKKCIEIPFAYNNYKGV